ncbi:unnamed protein product [Sphenostylis stenocarpa]|uniref:Uncharacterized protein n=1 Tax=Sphenostylis stenocarpa TaxID=92480 RepID=A0AA86SQ82_9FABA|nr:unnamed protein product [Sphenostylis stenocarpa]
MTPSSYDNTGPVADVKHDGGMGQIASGKFTSSWGLLKLEHNAALKAMLHLSSMHGAPSSR